ncbi:two-component system histidine kinase PnpS [Desulfotruncus alcoholivorax]|uniref:two-component system histidine kinase PnpS n=1 Tax=Desulfotruncus alcoholivorax TaxID=265477 RepID=UPI0003F86089|nr:sensor histidine kinase [Desulfotruncus alcoholivorax]
MNFLQFFRGIGWRPVASYFFMLLLFYTILKLYAVDKLDIFEAIVLAFPFAVGLAWVLYRRVIRPLNEIIGVSKEIARGNLERHLEINTPDEIGDLARSINDMADRLRLTIEEITEEKNRAQAILNSMADGVIAVDREERVIMVNPAAEMMFGLDQAECTGKNLMEAINNFDLDTALKRVQFCGKPHTSEVEFISPEPRTFNLRITPLNVSNQGGAVILLRDITERKRMEQMRSEFVANVSHELRTPLTSIRGFVETLLDSGTEDPEMTKHFLNIINTETRRLAKLVDELMYLSKIEERRGVHKWLQVEIGQLFDRVLAICGPQAEEKQIEIRANLPSRLPPLYGDPDMLAQVMINLMDNAIKYTPAGGSVTVGACLHGDEIRVDVADTGVGIPADSLPRIFERFYRVDKARSRELGGIGLGLAIVKHIVIGHGGSVEVKSNTGKGTVFSVYLPLENRRQILN